MNILKDIKKALFGEQGKHTKTASLAISKASEKMNVDQPRKVVASSGDWFKLNSKYGGCRIATSGYGSVLNIDSDHNDIAVAGAGARIWVGGEFNKVVVTGGGARVESVGFANVIACVGTECAVSAKVGSWITLAERKYSYEEGAAIPVYMKTEYVDGDRIKPDIMYTLIDGEFTAIDDMDFDFNFS